MYQFLNPVQGLFVALILSYILFTLMRFIHTKTVEIKNCKDMKDIKWNKFTHWIWMKFCRKNTTLLYNGLFWIAFITLFLIYPEAGACISSLLSIGLLLQALLFHEEIGSDDTWQYAAWLFWAFMLICGFFWLLIKGYEKTIGKFNIWLNNIHQSKPTDNQ